MVNYLCKRIVQQSLVGDEVQEADAILVQSQDMLRALPGISISSNL